ncbi:MAG: hypothetical protein JRC66_10105 [Deltaproteobacteria bacterium]|nr:hypothetical protein [Deltaproteobacteria bacterium]
MKIGWIGTSVMGFSMAGAMSTILCHFEGAFMTEKSWISPCDRNDIS